MAHRVLESGIGASDSISENSDVDTLLLSDDESDNEIDPKDNSQHSEHEIDTLLLASNGKKLLQQDKNHTEAMIADNHTDCIILNKNDETDTSLLVSNGKKLLQNDDKKQSEGIIADCIILNKNDETDTSLLASNGKKKKQSEGIVTDNHVDCTLLNKNDEIIDLSEYEDILGECSQNHQHFENKNDETIDLEYDEDVPCSQDIY